MAKLKLIRIGDGVGIILPAELLATLRAEIGDTLHVTKAPGGFRITPYDPDFEEQMELVARIAWSRRQALRELAN